MNQLPANPNSQSLADVREADLRQYLTFNLGGEAFAIPIARIREIIEFEGVTSIPLMPAFLRGVINLRGAVVPVLDLSARFGRGNSSIGKRSCVVILEVEQEHSLQSMGVLVDAVSEVISVAPSQMEPRPSFGANIRADFIESIINQDGRFIIALDLQQVVSIEEMAGLIGDTAQVNLSASPAGME